MLFIRKIKISSKNIFSIWIFNIIKFWDMHFYSFRVSVASAICTSIFTYTRTKPGIYFQQMPSYRGKLIHQQSTTSRQSLPASSRYMCTSSGRHRALRIRSDSVNQAPTRPVSIRHYQSYCRKARSAENLRNFRMSFNQSK